MQKILFLTDLIDFEEDLVFGLVGVDVETGKIHYYSFIQENNQIDPTNAIEFNPDDIQNAKLKICFANDGWQRKFIHDGSFTDADSLLILKAIETQKKYNKDFLFPTNYLDTNLNWLEIDYTFENSQMLARYSPKQNQINVDLDVMERIQRYYPSLYDRNQQFYGIILHELGHMKVSNIKLEKDKVIYYCGFSNFSVQAQISKINSTTIVFWPQKDKKELVDDKRKRILEEILNDYEVQNMALHYEPCYPRFGKIINSLCDNTLFMARYTHSMDTYYEKMENIIPSHNLACELLDILWETSVGEENIRKGEQEGKLILQRYLKVKQQQK